MRNHAVFSRLAIAAAAGVWLLAGSAQGGLFSDWDRSCKITFSGYARSEALANFPVLVKFGTNMTGFSYGQFLSSTNADLRFTDATQTNELSYEIDTWNTNGDSLVWVCMPVLTSSAVLYAYWGMTGQTVQAYSTNGATWTNYYFVSHDGGYTESSRKAATLHADISFGAVVAGGTNGVVGAATYFNGANNAFVWNTPGTMIDSATNATITCWMKSEAKASDYLRVLSRDGYGPWSIQCMNATSYRLAFVPGETQYSENNFVAVNGSFQHIGIVFRGSPNAPALGGEVTFFGDAVMNHTAPTTAGSVYDGSTRSFVVGGRYDQGTLDSCYKGTLDEIRFSRTAYSTNWIWAEWLSMVSNSVFASYSGVMISRLPFFETFEERTVGLLDGQNGWVGNPPDLSMVQQDVVYAGSNAAAIGPDGAISWVSAPNERTVWVDFYARPTYGTNDPVVTGVNPSAAFYVNTNGYLRVQDNNTWVTFNNYTVSTGQWYRFVLGLDYLTSKWELHVADSAPDRVATMIATNLAFSSSATNAFFNSYQVRHWWFVVK